MNKFVTKLWALRPGGTVRSTDLSGLTLLSEQHCCRTEGPRGPGVIAECQCDSTDFKLVL